MPSVTAVDEHFFSGGDIEVAGLAIRVDDLADRLGLEIRTWNEDGLGPARGMVCRLPSGRLVALRELTYAVEYHGQRGPDVIVAGDDLVALGADALVSEILAAFGLPRSAVDWVMDREGERSIAEMLAKWRASRSAPHP